MGANQPPTGVLRPDDFEGLYQGTPPWDIGRAQEVFVALADKLTGHVLDVGCGTGEHALFAAQRGLRATGVDISRTAIAKGQEKAAARGLNARFVVGDVMQLESLGERFDTVLDCGLFHVFPADEAAVFIRSLHGVMNPGGRYYLLGFNEQVPGTDGPRRLKQADIRSEFTEGWRIESIEASHIETNLGFNAPAWLATIIRV